MNPRRALRPALHFTTRIAAAALVSIGVTACYFAPPSPNSLSRADRLSMLPLDGHELYGEVELRWNDRMVPFILASDERDVPYAIGLVHAHLRLGQMEILRRIGQGRTAEIGGPFATEVDQLLRTIDFDRAVNAIERRLPEETRTWLQRYVDGINAWREGCDDDPPEWAALGFDDEAWTIDDVIRNGRVLSTDINWARFFQAARLRGERNSEEWLARLRKFDDEGRQSFGPDQPTELSFLVGRSKSGSNSIVVSGSKTESGAAMIANDPHLGFLQPNLCVALGYRVGDHAVCGFTFPSLPFVVIGRNEQIAWGGTNMVGISTTIYDVSGMPEEQFSERREGISVRLLPDETVVIRETPLGPILSDIALLEDYDLPPLAMHWRGHRPSDEWTALLNIQRATDWLEFRAAFGTWAVGAQNFLYADRDGHVGQLLAMEFDPASGRAADSGPFVPYDDERFAWDETKALDATELPIAYDPIEGFLVSCNNVPVRTDPPITVAGNWNDRTVRLQDLIRQTDQVTIEDMFAWQHDVHSTSSLRSARAMLHEAGEGASGAAVEAIRDWTGDYETGSVGAAAYQLALAHVLDTHYVKRFGEAITDTLRSSAALHTFVAEDLEAGRVSDSEIAAALAFADEHEAGTKTWGSMHRVLIRHPLGFVPLIGSGYDFGERPIAGTTGTVQKSAAPVTADTQSASYGAIARHVTDLSDLDSNHFVLLGGQDGWFGSEHALDQLDLWDRREYVRIPLRLKTLRAEFRTVQSLRR